ncbi:MAG: hypothetical protein NTZ05_00270 [Chloroflexi bacterium]|nr:hypothetical protein [Chloroflexota bacterium]
MAGRSPAAAVTNFVAPLQKVASLITDSVLVRTGHAPGQAHLLAFRNAEPVRLRGGVRLQLRIRHHYRVVSDDAPERGPWRVQTAAYDYSLRDLENREIVAYHWHPNSQSDTEYPHLHVFDGELAHAHLPTGRVALEDVVRLAIERFRVPPKVGAKEDWRAVLTGSQRRFEVWRSWHGAGPLS